MLEVPDIKSIGYRGGGWGRKHFRRLNLKLPSRCAKTVVLSRHARLVSDVKRLTFIRQAERESLDVVLDGWRVL